MSVVLPLGPHLEDSPGPVTVNEDPLLHLPNATSPAEPTVTSASSDILGRKRKRPQASHSLVILPSTRDYALCIQKCIFSAASLPLPAPDTAVHTADSSAKAAGTVPRFTDWFPHLTVLLNVLIVQETNLSEMNPDPTRKSVSD